MMNPSTSANKAINNKEPCGAFGERYINWFFMKNK
jgi:hypothetical protein